MDSIIEPVERGRHGACVVRQYSTDPLSVHLEGSGKRGRRTEDRLRMIDEEREL
jgi:hypothetical protein